MDFEVNEGILKINKQLDDDYDVSFDRACSELVASKCNALIIDLTNVKSITSTYIGLLAATFFAARSHHKSLTIIARGQVRRVLIIAGFENFMPIVESKTLE